MIRRLCLAFASAALALAGCVTSQSAPQFQGANYSLSQASQDNTALGIQYLKSGNRNAAMEKIQKAIEQDPSNANAYTAEAIVYNAGDEVEKARSAYKTAMSKAPDDPEIENDYAIFLCQRGDPKGSIDYFLKAANNPHYSTPDGAYTNAGLCATLIPDTAAADQYFRKALALNPYLTEPLFQLAQISYNQKNYLSARAFIERYDTLVPKSRPDVLLLGMNNERALGNKQGAADYAKQLLQRYPTSQQAQQVNQVPRG